MGSYVRARSADKGLEKLLSDQGISYHPILELGNLFMELDDWRPAYRELLRQSGDLLAARLDGLHEPFCLLLRRETGGRLSSPDDRRLPRDNPGMDGSASRIATGRCPPCSE